MNKAGNKIQVMFGQLQLSPTTGVGAPMVVGNTAFTGGVEGDIINKSTISGDIARLVVLADAVQVALYAAPGAQSIPVVTGGPVGGQAILRTLGAQPIVIGTNNAYVAQFLSGGGLVIATPSGSVSSLVVNAKATQRALQLFPGDSASVGLEIVDPGPNNTLFRVNTNNSQVNIQAIGSSTSMSFQTSGGVALILTAASANAQFTGSLSMNNLTPYAGSAGWGTPTGTSVIANFPGASASLVQCSTAIATIIAILKNFGLMLT